MRAQARDHAEADVVQRVLDQLGTRLSACTDLPSLRAALDETLPGFALRQRVPDDRRTDQRPRRARRRVALARARDAAQLWALTSR